MQCGMDIILREMSAQTHTVQTYFVCVCSLPCEHCGMPHSWCLRCGRGSVVKHHGPTVELSGLRQKFSLRSFFLNLLDMNLSGAEPQLHKQTHVPRTVAKCFSWHAEQLLLKNTQGRSFCFLLFIPGRMTNPPLIYKWAAV